MQHNVVVKYHTIRHIVFLFDFSGENENKGKISEGSEMRFDYTFNN
jgi:hypothetical protein